MPRQQQRRASDFSDNLIDEIVATKPRSTSLKSPRESESFLRQYFADVPYEDIHDRTPKIMGLAAASHLDFAKVRKPGTPLLRIFNPDEKIHGYQSPYTIIEMVNDNMPFLVDSLSAAIERQKLAIHMTVHPVLRVQRDKRGRLTAICEPDDESGITESFVRIAVDREGDEQHLSVLSHQISKVLADVRIAVRDWRKMRDKMLDAASHLSRGPGWR